MTRRSERQAVLTILLSEVERELDELSELLGQQLDSFDQELTRAVRGLPSWLDLPVAKVRQELRFDEDGPFGETMLGPHAVAFAAGELDRLVRTWLGADGLIKDAQLHDEAQLARFRADFKRLDATITQLGDAATARARAARDTYDLWREHIRIELDEQRVADQERVEAMVARGELDPSAKQHEVARLWDEQRECNDHLQRSWRGVQGVARQGDRLTREGLLQLKKMSRRTSDRIERTYLSGAPDPPTEPPLSSAPPTPAEAPRRRTPTPHVNERPEPRRQRAHTPRSASLMLAEDVEHRHHLEAIERETPDAAEFDPELPPLDDPSEAGPMLSFEDSDPELAADPFGLEDAGPTLPPKELLLIAPTSEVEQGFDPYHDAVGADFTLPPNDPMSFDEDDALDTLLLSASAGGGEAPAAGGPMIDFEDDEATPNDPSISFITQAMEDTSSPLDDGSDPLLSEPSEPERLPYDDEDAQLDRHDARDDDEGDEGDEGNEAEGEAPDDADASDEALTPPKPTPSPEDRKPHRRKTPPPIHLDDEEDDRPPRGLVAVRVREGLTPLASGELMALTIPLLVSALISGASLLAATQGAGVNLLASTPWAAWVVLGCLLWSLIIPFARSWRVTWSGFVPTPWRHATIRDEVDLSWDARGFELGPWVVYWEEIEEIARERWHSPADHTQGWMLHITLFENAPLVLVAEAEGDSWEMASLPVRAAPTDAWQLDTRGLEALQLRCVRAVSARQRAEG